MAYMRILGSIVQGQSLKRTLTVTDEKCNRFSQSEGLVQMLERGYNGRQGEGKGERTAIGSLYHRIQEVKSGAVMPWTG